MNSSMIILLVVMVLAFYFLIMRPQRKRQQQQQEMQKKLEPGTRVMTTTGIYGTIVASGDRQLVIQTSPEGQLTVLKQAVARVVKDDEEDAELRPYQAATPRVPDDLSGLTEAQPDQSAGAGQGQNYGQTSAASGSDSESATPQTATGMAGGAPIQEYTPGQTPDFTEPEHATAPWPSMGNIPEGSADGDTDQHNQDQSDSVAGSFGGSVLGGSSLAPSSEETNDRDDNSERTH
jgi:preprotein translocase subunit YajC